MELWEPAVCFWKVGKHLEHVYSLVFIIIFCLINDHKHISVHRRQKWTQTVEWLNFTPENCPTYDTLIKFTAHSMSFSTFFKKETNTSVIAITTVVFMIDYQPEVQYLNRGLEVNAFQMCSVLEFLIYHTCWNKVDTKHLHLSAIEFILNNKRL